MAILALIFLSLFLLPLTGHAATTTGSNPSAEAAAPLLKAGIDAYNAGDYTAAVADLKQAQALLPDKSSPALYLGLAYLKQDNLSQAIDAWQRYIKLTPDTQTEKTNDLQATVARDLTILLREQNRVQAQAAIANESSIGPPDPNAVAITYYRNLGSPELSPLQKGLAELIIADVSKVPNLKVVERDRLQALLDEMKLGSSGLADPNTVARSGRLLGAARVVTGTYVDPTKGQLHVESTLAQAGSTQPLSPQTDSSERFYEIEKRLSAEILSNLGYSEAQLKSRGLWQAVETPQTTNFKAFVDFSNGLEAKDNQDYAKARGLFQQALAEDPTFTLALQMLNRTPMAAMSVAAVANSVGAQAPAAATVVAALPILNIGASVPHIPAVVSAPPPAPPPPPPPLAPPAIPVVSFPHHP